MNSKIIITILACLLIVTVSYSQIHSIYGTTGNAHSLAYELTLGEKKNENKFTRIALKVNAGTGFVITLFNEEGDDYKTIYYGGGLVALFGEGQDILELGAGVNVANRTKNGVDNGNYTLFMGNVGYRREMGSFVLRVGLSVPELVYVGAGFRF